MVERRGGEPGFIRIESPTSIIWPVYDGNGMFLALGNLEVNPKMHLLSLGLRAAMDIRAIDFDQ